MKDLTVRIPENKLAFFLELINSLGFVKIDQGESDSSILSKEQIKLIEEERTKIKTNSGYLINWEEARKSLKHN